MAFARGDAGQAWLATMRGLALLDTNTGTIAQVSLPGYPNIALRSLARDDDGTLWLGSQLNGLLHYDPRTGRVRAYAPKSATP
ncbi:two-component regulator propeller domain-containing protein, partial [Enterococcus casseliflavus]|uniref:two-component regulator propeller domain-containing protein n=1 Tax=Enterococcus casseliflavus TaxID=37734 RepID=UPI003D122879